MSPAFLLLCVAALCFAILGWGLACTIVLGVALLSLWAAQALTPRA